MYGRRASTIYNQQCGGMLIVHPLNYQSWPQRYCHCLLHLLLVKGHSAHIKMCIRLKGIDLPTAEQDN